MSQKTIKTVDYWTQQYANEYRALIQYKIKAEGSKEALRKILTPIYGDDFVGDDPWGFLENHLDSLLWKFSEAYGIKIEEAAEAINHFAEIGNGTTQDLYVSLGRALGIEVNL